MRTMVVVVVMVFGGCTDRSEIIRVMPDAGFGDAPSDHQIVDCCMYYPDNGAVVSCLSANLPHGACGRARACVEGGTDYAVCGK